MAQRCGRHFPEPGFRNYDTLRAYDLDTKARLGDRDIVDHWIGYANGIWSDGEVVAVSETQSHRIYVYDLNSGGWRPWLGFRLDSSNHNSHGLWSDGVTLWVVDHADDKLYAYHWRGENPGDRRPELDFALTDGNGRGAGLWSDGTTMWVSDGEDAKIYAYSFGQCHVRPPRAGSGFQRARAHMATRRPMGSGRMDP